MNNLKIVYSNNNFLFELEMESQIKVYKETFDKNTIKKVLVKYLDILYKEQDSYISNSFLKSVLNMTKLENKVMLIYKNKLWKRYEDFETVQRISQSLDQSKVKNETILLKDLLNQNVQNNNSIVKELETNALKNPNDDYAIFKYGAILFEVGRYDDAIDTLREAISLKEDKAEYYYFLGLAYLKLDKFNLAISEIVTAVTLEPDNFEYLKSLAEVYYKMGKYHDSIEIYHALFEINIDKLDELVDVQIDLGNVYNKLEYYEDAIHLFDDILILEPNNLLAKQGYQEAHVIKKRLTSADMNNLGIAYAEKNKFDKAIEKFKKAIEIDPDDSEFYFNLAMAYKKNNMIIQASLEFKNVLRIDNNFIDAHAELGDIYYQQNNIEGAIKEYQVFIDKSNDLDRVEAIKGLLLKLKVKSV